jgi:hypothetical protein
LGFNCLSIQIDTTILMCLKAFLAELEEMKAKFAKASAFLSLY